MLQLGTKVKIREDLAVGKLYFGDNNSLLATRLCTSNMSYYKGQIAEIIAIKKSILGTYYLLDIDVWQCYWVESMFELMEDNWE